MFELDFEENLRIVRQCVKYGTRIIFPSTSEVYGMSPDAEFSEDDSTLVLGPIHKQRWIYSCSKQLLDRVIWAYGQDGKLQFSLIRPFNWIGPKLDDLYAAKEGSSRVVTQFILNLLQREPIKLVDGGYQKRCFTYVEDGIDCLMRIIENQGGVADGQIFNIGNPDNEASVKELAHLLRDLFKAHPDHKNDGVFSEIVETPHEDYYGKGYQDITSRKPSIAKARTLLGWEPVTDLTTSLQITLDSFLEEAKTAADVSVGAGFKPAPTGANPAGDNVAPRLAIKVDVDTLEGFRQGVPALMEVLEAHAVKASFFLALGPDHSGRAIFRIFRQRGFLEKMWRTRAPALYGFKTMCYGTLLPGPKIGAAAPHLAPQLAAAGHEVGLHGYDHVRWHDHLYNLPPEKVAREIDQAQEAYTSLMGRPASAFAAPGWQCSWSSRTVLAARNFLYASDTRGAAPYFPAFGDTVTPVLEIPTTLPTLDELLGFHGCRPQDFTSLVLSRLEAGAAPGSHHPRRNGRRPLPGRVRPPAEPLPGAAGGVFPAGGLGPGTPPGTGHICRWRRSTSNVCPGGPVASPARDHKRRAPHDCRHYRRRRGGKTHGAPHPQALSPTGRETHPGPHLKDL